MNIAKQDAQQQLLASPASRQWEKIGFRDHHGIVIPLFSLHSKTSCGIGEYPDLIPLIQWCRKVGFEVIQLLPLNDTGLETSPYSALSAFALNPIHLGLSRLPYLEANPELQKRIKELQVATGQNPRLDYKNIQEKREAFLRAYYKEYGPKIKASSQYQNFKNKQAYWLQDYAVFKALKILQNWTHWQTWPAEFKNPSAQFFQQLPKEIADEAEYHTFIQFLCFEQFEEVKRLAEEAHIYLKGDIPILINRESADVWRHRELFSLDFSAGAPPDMYSQEGQKWGFPLYNWDAAAKENYHWWIERLKTSADLYHIYRIDHVVGFFRIWAIPLTVAAKFGHYLPEDEKQWIPQGKNLMQVMLDNCPMLPIGEDLGQVPPEVRVCLRNQGICGTKVMRWERNWHGDQSFFNPKEYAPESMTTVSTHDSETLALWWKNHPEEASVYAKSMGWDYSPVLEASQRFAILRASHQSGSLFHINLLPEYLALIPGMTWPDLEDERINVPGTISESNWSYRLRPSVEELVENEEFKQNIQKIVNFKPR